MSLENIRQSLLESALVEKLLVRSRYGTLVSVEDVEVVLELTPEGLLDIFIIYRPKRDVVAREEATG